MEAKLIFLSYPRPFRIWPGAACIVKTSRGFKSVSSQKTGVGRFWAGKWRKFSPWDHHLNCQVTDRSRVYRARKKKNVKEVCLFSMFSSFISIDYLRKTFHLSAVLYTSNALHFVPKASCTTTLRPTTAPSTWQVCVICYHQFLFSSSLWRGTGKPGRSG